MAAREEHAAGLDLLDEIAAQAEPGERLVLVKDVLARVLDADFEPTSGLTRLLLDENQDLSS